MEKYYITLNVGKIIKNDNGTITVRHEDDTEHTMSFQEFNDHYFEVKNVELASTCMQMVSYDYQERFLAEYIQLKNRLIGLAKMLDNWDKGNLNFTPNCPRCTYKLQMKAMEDYIAILTMRANMEGIDLPENK